MAFVKPDHTSQSEYALDSIRDTRVPRAICAKQTEHHQTMCLEERALRAINITLKRSRAPCYGT